MRISLACLAVLAFAVRFEAAPAPFPRAVADTVVRILNKTEQMSLVKRLRSRDFAASVLMGEKARKLNCVKGHADAAAWLAARMKVTPVRDGEALRIRLENCPTKEALVLLSAVLEVCLDEMEPARPTLRQQVKSYQEFLNRCVPRKGVGKCHIEIFIAHCQAKIVGCEQLLRKMDGGLILQQPRLLKGNR